MLRGESKYIMSCLFYIIHIKNVLARVVKRSCQQSSSGYQSVISKSAMQMSIDKKRNYINVY